MIMFVLVGPLVIFSFGAVLIAMSALDRANELHERQTHTDDYVSELGERVRRLRREDAGYPPVPDVRPEWTKTFETPRVRDEFWGLCDDLARKFDS